MIDRLVAASVVCGVLASPSVAEDTRLLVQHWQRAQTAERYTQAETLANAMLAAATTAGQKAAAWEYLGRARAAQGRLADAEQAFNSGLQIRLSTSDTGNASLPYRLGLLYLDQKKFAEAEPLLKRAVDFYEREPTISKSETASVLYDLGTLEHDRQDYARAETYHRKALELRREIFGEQHALVGLSLAQVADMARHQQQYERAAAMFKQSIDTLEKTAGPEHPQLGIALNELGEYHRALNDFATAEAVHRRRLEIFQKRYWSGDVRIFRAKGKVAYDLEKQGKTELAAQMRESAKQFTRPQAEITSRSVKILDASNKELLTAAKGAMYFVRRIEKPHYIVEVPLPSSKPDGWILQKDALLIGGPSPPPPMWNRFYPPKARVSMEFPASPSHALSTGAGLVFDTYFVQTDGVMYRLAYFDRPPGLDRQEGISALTEVLKGKLIRQQDVEIAGRPGLQVDVALQDGATYRMHTVTVDQVVYELSALGEQGLIDGPDVARFLNSFEMK